MATKLFVGNLIFQTSSEDLQQLFAKAGTDESSSDVEDRDTRRSRGFGLIEMSSKEEGEAAIAQFNGKEVTGRVYVNEAKPRENRGGGSPRGGKRREPLARAWGGASEVLAVIEIASGDDVKALPNTAQTLFRPEQEEEIARYLTEITESRERARKTQNETNRLKKKTLAIIEDLS